MKGFSLAAIPDAVAAYLPPSPRLECAEQGMTADVMFASGAGQSVVIKRCANPIYLSWIRREQANLRLLSETTLPIPRAICYTETLGADGIEGWLVTTRLTGQSLWKVVLETPPPEIG